MKNKTLLLLLLIFLNNCSSEHEKSKSPPLVQNKKNAQYSMISPIDLEKKINPSLRQVNFYRKGKRVLTISGFYINENLFITVVSKDFAQDKIKIIGKNGKEINAKILALEPSIHFALLKTEEKNLTYFIDINQQKKDEKIIQRGEKIIGFLKISDEKNYKSIHGRLLGKDKLYLNVKFPIIMPRIFLRGNKSSYGLPVFDKSGSFIGMIANKNKNFNWIIPKKALKFCLQSYLENDIILHAWFAAGVEESTMPTIAHLDENSPIKKAGGKIGDIIWKINQKEIKNVQELFNNAFCLLPNHEVKLELLREFETIEIKITPPPSPIFKIKEK